MRNASSDFKIAINKNSRTLCSKMIFDKFEIDDRDIISISIDESIISSENFELGGAISTNVDVTLSNYLNEYNETSFKDLYFNLMFGIELQDGKVEFVEFGKYKVFEVKETGKNLKLECYDALIDMDIIYNTKIQYPSPITTILNDIAKTFKVELSENLQQGKFKNSDLVIATKPEESTYRQILKDIATIVGGFAVIKNGTLDIINIIESDGEINTVNSIKTTISSEFDKITLVNLNNHPTGKLGNALDIEIALLDSNSKEDINKVAANILNTYKDFSYTAFKSEWQGNLLYELGDTIKVTDINGNEYTSFISSNKLNYAGGLKATTETKTDKKTAKTANREVQRLQSQIKEAQNGMYYYSNDSAVDISQDWGQFSFIGFSLSGSTNLLLNVALNIEGAGIVEGKILLDSAVMSFLPKVYINQFGLMAFTIPLIQLKASQAHAFTLMLKADNSMVIKEQQGQITIFGDKLTGALSDEYPHAEVEEEIKFNDFDILNANVTDSSKVTLETVINSVASEVINYNTIETEIIDAVNISIVEYGYMNDIKESFKDIYVYNPESIDVTDEGMTIKTIESEHPFIKTDDNIYEIELIDVDSLENIYSEVM